MSTIIRFVINMFIVLLLMKFATAFAVTFVIGYVLYLVVDQYISIGLNAAKKVAGSKQYRDAMAAQHARQR